MDTSEFEIGQVKQEIDCNDFNAVAQTDTMKYVCKVNVFNKYERYDESLCNETNLVDYKSATYSYQEQNEENFDAKPEYVCEDVSADEYNPDKIKIKNENNIDIFYEDIKRETDEEKSSELSKSCGVCSESFSSETEFDSKNNRFSCSCQQQNNSINRQNEDVKLPSLAPDFGLQPFLKNDERSNNSSDENDGFVKPQMTKSSGLKTHAGEKPFHCKTCPKTFSKTKYLNAHEMIHTRKKPFQCKICPKSFCKAKYLNAHEKLHTGEKPFHCKICFKTFSETKSLNAHEMTHKEEKEGLFHCKICSKTFSKRQYLNAHKMTHTEEKPFHCKICFKNFKETKSLNAHAITHKGEKEGPFHCKICNKTFSKSRYFETHESIHTLEKPFHCKICSKTFILNSINLKIHKSIHRTVKSFHCKICSKYFKSLRILKVHERIHTGEKPFYCKICSKTFYMSSSNFQVHESIHARAKPFHCKICLKSFSSLQYVKIHERVHTGEKHELKFESF